MSSEAIQEARTLLIRQRDVLRGEATRIAEEIRLTTVGIEALTAILDPLTGAKPADQGTGHVEIPVPTTVHGKANTRPFIAKVLRDHPGKHHAKQITDWLGEYITQTAKNPVTANSTTLLRMQMDGLVKNHGGNVWEWVGEATDAPATGQAVRQESAA